MKRQISQKFDTIGTDQNGLERGKKAANMAGILAAFGIAFGGLFFVRNRLIQEEAQLMRSGGAVEVQVQSAAMETVELGEEEMTIVLLTEEELYHVVEKLETSVDAYPHEPWEGQLSMVEAEECGRVWIEDFLLPAIGIEGYRLQNYSVNCYLWAWQEDIDRGDRDPVHSYWSVRIGGAELTADLVLNAVTGQVLNASVSSTLVVEYQSQHNLMQLLYDYADSFELKGTYIQLYSGETGENRLIFQGTGEKELSASVKTSSVVLARPESYAEVYEIFHIDLGMGTGK